MNHRHLAAVLVAAITIVVGPAASPAIAHGAGSSTANNYRTRITSITGGATNTRVKLIQAGNRVQLQVRGTQDAIVRGYQGEPYLRVGPTGVFENRRSPATYLNTSRDGSAPIPAQADAKADPEWVQISKSSTARWHDHRIHWMGGERPQQVAANPKTKHVIEPAWQIPIDIGDETVVVAGDLMWIPPPRAAWWLAAAIVLGVGLTIALRTSRWRSVASAALVAALVLDIVQSYGYYRASTDALDLRLWLFIYNALTLVALWRYGKRHRHATEPPLSLALAGLLVFFMGGIDRIEALYNSQVAFGLSPLLARIASATSLAVGAATILGTLPSYFARRAVTEPRPAITSVRVPT